MPFNTPQMNNNNLNYKKALEHFRIPEKMNKSEKIDFLNKKIKETDPKMAETIIRILAPFIKKTINNLKIIQAKDCKPPLPKTDPFTHLWTLIYTDHSDLINKLPIKGRPEGKGKLTTLEILTFIANILLKKIIKKWVMMSSNKSVSFNNDWPPTIQSIES